MIQIEISKLPQNSKIREITTRAIVALADLITEHEDEVNALLCETEEGPVTLAHSIKIDLGKNAQTDKLSFSLKTSDEITGELSDPEQPELPVTAKGGESC